GLVRTDSDGSIKNGIAKDWDISDDSMTYVFHLYDNTKWSNSTPVTADDFVFGITRALTKSTGSEDATDLFLIKNASSYYNGESDKDSLGIKALDDTTLQIELEYESNALLQILTEPVAMPCNEEFFNSTKGKYGKSQELIITNGPFKIRDNYGWDHEKYIYIRRSENYNAANPSVPLGVNFNFISHSDDPITALLNGDTDVCEIYGDQLDEASEKGLNITTNTNTLWGICYNTDITAFKNAKLRVSLFSSLNRNYLLKDVPESYVKTSQLIADGVLFAGRNYRDTAGTFELDKTNNYAAMYSKGISELKEKNIEVKSSYTILYLDDDTSSNIVNSIIEVWNDLSGCYFNKQPLSRKELEERINSGDYEIAIAPLNTAVDSPMEFLSKFTSDSPNNYINLNYPAYNDFIETAISESGENSVNALMDAESYLINYGYLYPLYYESRYYASHQNVNGVIFDTSGEALDFTQVEKITQE
ncbi:MAG: peptide ABC transporter substrate-binding protein, partial [Clostridia bacterium]|nr:peptide ABC transporter substrate-binding protein [Clostridia bacterium]